MVDKSASPIERIFSQHPLFAALSETAHARWAREFELMNVPLGKPVFLAGQRGDAAYLIERGRMRIVRECGGVAVSLGTFGAGAFFGAHAIPAHWNRTVTCRAAEDSLLYRIPREAVERLLAEHPEFEHYFDKSLEESVLLEFLGLSRLLLAVPAEHLIPTLDALGVASFARGEVVLREGEPGDSLYIVRSGRLEVRRQFGGAERRLCEMLPGDYVGERSLVLGTPRSATVVALEDCECFTLGPRGFEELLRAAPSLPNQLRARFPAYEQSWVEEAGAQDVVLVPIRRQRAAAMFETSADRGLGEGVPLPQDPVLRLLRLSEFTRGLPPEFATAMLPLFREVRCRAGDRLPSTGLVVLRSGRARSVDQRSGASPVELRPGDWQGARRLLKRPEPAYVAMEDTECLQLDAPALETLSRRFAFWDAHVRRLADHALPRPVAEAASFRELPQRQASSGAVEASGTLKRELQRAEAGSFGHDDRGRQAPSGAAEASGTLKRELQLAEAGSFGHEDRGRQASSGAAEASGTLKGELQRGHGVRRRRPWVAQRSENECGVAALLMIARWHGLPVTYAEARSAVELLPRGASVLQLTRSAEALGFECLGVTHDLDALAATDLPAIAVWQESHYVVVYHIGRRSVTVGDPAVGIVRMPRERFRRGWSGQLIALRKMSDARGGNCPADALTSTFEFG